MSYGIILNEKDLREARARLARMSDALSSETALEQIAAGLPPQVITQVAKMISFERQELLASIEAYEAAKESHDPATLQARAGSDAGITLIVARIAKGYSQKDLAWRLGVKEQQVQRYEADRYASISLKNYIRIASLLGVRLQASIQENPDFRGLDSVIENVSKESIRKIIKHGRANKWFSEDTDELTLQKFIAENRIEFGSPSLLRTGLNVVDHSEDILLHAWRARVAILARETLAEDTNSYDPLDIRWLSDLPRLSVYKDGPVQAQAMLRTKGVLLIVERQIPGLAIDGAAFLERGVPVIGLTIRRDSIDSFWFTLLHEVAHIVLHYRTGLATGFFDQTEAASADEQEAEADLFASNLLIPEERWRRSTARITQSAQVVEKFASDVGVNPAIVFGRIRKERNNYSIFSSKIGGGTVREMFSMRN